MLCSTSILIADAAGAERGRFVGLLKRLDGEHGAREEDSANPMIAAVG